MLLEELERVRIRCSQIFIWILPVVNSDIHCRHNQLVGCPTCYLWLESCIIRLWLPYGSRL